jgi:hypothetical protein
MAQDFVAKQEQLRGIPPGTLNLLARTALDERSITPAAYDIVNDVLSEAAGRDKNDPKVIELARLKSAVESKAIQVDPNSTTTFAWASNSASQMAATAPETRPGISATVNAPKP